MRKLKDVMRLKLDADQNHQLIATALGSAVIQSQASWGAMERVEKGKRVIRLAPMTIDNDELTAWLIEAAVRYIGKPVSVPTL